MNPERLIPLRDVPKLDILPARRLGSRLSISTVFRWAMTGQRGHRLRTWCVGGQRCTTLAALQQYFEAVARPVCKVDSPDSKTTKTHRSRKEIEAQLDQLGI